MTTDADNRRAFNQVLVNTFIANLTTSYLWFALTFWVYLETRSVLPRRSWAAATCCCSR